MKQLFILFTLLIYFCCPVPAQEIANDSEETLLEQAIAHDAELFPSKYQVKISDGVFDVTHPLFIGVDDVTVSSYVGDVTTNNWLSAFNGTQVWGAAFDINNNKIYFNSGATLYEWSVGGTATLLGTITDTAGANQSLVGLAFYNGELYGMKNVANEAIYKINTSTFVATVFIDYADADFDLGGLAIDPNNGNIYATNDDTTPFGSGLFRINNDGTGTFITAYPSGQTDIDGLAVSNNSIAYLIIDEPGSIYVYDLVANAYGTPLTNPWTTSEVFSGGTWIYETGGGGFGLPEVLYYLFDEAGSSTTQNFAVPGSGSQFADVLGGLTMGPTGQFDDGLIGSGGSSSTDYVNSGWIPDLGTSSWTISMYLNNLPAGSALNYLFGGTVAVGWRCFYSGAAGQYGVLMRLTGIGGSDITVPGVGPGPSVLTFVYDSSVPTVYAYINGALTVTQPQAGALNMTGTDNFKVGAYGSSTGMPAGSIMDEFRFYNRALDATEVAATWNISIVPVELTSFTASVTGTDVKLLWQTATELNNSGFSVERKIGNSEFVEVAFVPGFGTTSEPKSYSFTDQNLRSDHYTYRLKQIDFDGTFTYSNEVAVDVVAPASFSLDQNYPNPFNPSTKITFSLAVDSKVSLKVFDVLGQQVISLIDQDLSQGVHTYDFNAAGINSGVYFYKIEATGVNGSEYTDVKKMILLK